MTDGESRDVQSSYDLVADEYARRIFDELEHKPLDRQLLDRFAARVQAIGPSCDVGCGPGHLARYLHERGTQVIGVDLSPEMVSHARRLNPGIEFKQGDMRSLDVEDGAWGGIVAFYSLIHIPRPEVTEVLREFKRVLRPGGMLLLAFHIGDDVLHLDEWWGQQVSVDFIFFRPDEMISFLRSAGFQVGEVIERDPYPDVEHPSRRAYIFAEKPRGEDQARNPSGLPDSPI
jgi:SAM-dependent methyltransferase